MRTCDVVIVGAGPYGLSIAAHLKALGVNFRIFGSPMHTWRTQMPKGMRLKSEGFASSLDDPDSAFTLGAYCKQQGLPYADLGSPVPLDTFISYGMEFQKRYVPNLEHELVTAVKQVPEGFQVGLRNGEVFAARRIVLAVGISHFAYVPPELSALPEEFATHSSRHSSLDRFKGKEVAVVGAGASAVDLAALLYEAGISVQLVARKPKIRFHDPAQIPRPLMDRIQYPMTGIGPGWKLVFCTRAPHLFRKLPEQYRLNSVKTILGPAPGWFVKQQVVGKVPFNLGVNITEAKVQNGRVSLQLTDDAGAQRTLTVDHVVAATGYRVDLKRLAFLDSGVQASLRSVEHTPVLSSHFESSVPGLYFVGVAAANMFGPLLRFAYGARFTARRISKHLAKSAVRDLPQQEPVAKMESVDRDEVLTR
jgi:thioredoxin reductase